MDKKEQLALLDKAIRYKLDERMELMEAEKDPKSALLTYIEFEERYRKYWGETLK